MHNSSINQKFWYLIISFCTILLLVSSCALKAPEKISVSRYILQQYLGSYRLGPDSIARVTLEGNQLFISSCPLIGLSISPDILKQYVDGNRPWSDFNAMVTSEVNLMAKVIDQKKYPIYAKSNTKFVTKTRFPAQIEFFKNDKGEVTHFIVKKNLRDQHDLHLIKKMERELDVGLMGMGTKIVPDINIEQMIPYNNPKDI